MNRKRAKSKGKAEPAIRLTSFLIRSITKEDRALLNNYKATVHTEVDSKALVRMLRKHVQLVKQHQQTSRDLADLRRNVATLIDANARRARADQDTAAALKAIGTIPRDRFNDDDDDDTDY